jgi:hypothetical protein
MGNPAQYAAYGATTTMERWDLASFVPLPAGQKYTAAIVAESGDALRRLTHTYKLGLES